MSLPNRPEHTPTSVKPGATCLHVNKPVAVFVAWGSPRPGDQMPPMANLLFPGWSGLFRALLTQVDCPMRKGNLDAQFVEPSFDPQ